MTPDDKNAALADKLQAMRDQQYENYQDKLAMHITDVGAAALQADIETLDQAIAALRSAPSERANATWYGDPFCDPVNRFLMHKHFKGLCPTAGEKEYIALEITMNTIFSGWRTEPQIRALASSAAPSEGEWRPPVSAPKDGTVFVGLCWAWNKPNTVEIAHLVKWFGGEWWIDGTNDKPHVLTRWMPAPPRIDRNTAEKDER